MTKLTKANGYKKTDYEMMVVMTSSCGIYRRVYEKDGRYFVSYKSEIWDVTKEALKGAWRYVY